MAWIEIGGTLYNLANAHRVHAKVRNEVSRSLMIDDHEAFVGTAEEVQALYAAVLDKLRASSELVREARLREEAAPVAITPDA